MSYLFSFFTSFIITSFVMPFLINYLDRIGIVDRPNKRRINKNAVPRMGGIIVLPILFLFLFTYINDINAIKYYIYSAVLILLCGAIDDIIGLNWKHKFFIQGVSVFFLLLFLNNNILIIKLFSFVLPNWLGIIVTFIFILGSINSVNLFDGLDGLVSGYGFILLFPIFLLSIFTGSFFVALVAIVSLGILLGILKYNTFPAKVFLGDSGSLAIGHILITSLLLLTPAVSLNNALDLTFSIMIIGVPIIDTLKVMFERILNKKSPFLPAKDHMHHIIFGNEIRHKTTVFIIHFLSILFIINALLYQKYNSVFYYFTYAILALIVIFMKPLIDFFRDKGIIKYYIDTYYLSQRFFFDKVKIFLFPLSLFFFIALILVNISIVKVIHERIMNFIAISGLLIMLLALFKQRKQDSIPSIYFFFNISFLLVLNTYSATSYGLTGFFASNIIAKMYLIFILLFVITLIFIFLGRDLLFPKDTVFFTGMDLSLVSFLLSILVIKEFFPWNIKNYVHALFVSLTLYFWFKIFSHNYPRLGKAIYYSSFILNFLIVAYSYLFIFFNS